MQDEQRYFVESAATLAKAVALALVLATVFAAGRIVIALLAVDGRTDFTEKDVEITQLAYRHATSQPVSLPGEQPDAF